MEVVASLSQGHTAAAQCGLFTHKSVPVIFDPTLYFPPCAGTVVNGYYFYGMQRRLISAFCHGVNEVPAFLGCVEVSTGS